VDDEALRLLGSRKPKADTRKLHQSEVVLRSLLVSRGDGPKSLQVVEEDFDTIALAVQLLVEASSVVLACGVVADNGLHALCTNRCDDAVCVVRCVGDKSATAGMRQQLFRHGRVMLLTWRQRELKGPTLSIDNGVDLR